MKRAMMVVLALALAACERTGSTYVAVPLHGAGALRAPFEVEGWSVELDRADVAFGPVWLCATMAADPEFCATSVLELTETVTIDGLAPAPEPLGTMHGIRGSVRSAMFDYGISWLPTAARAAANEGAPEGRSARFAGTATRGAESFAFTCDLELTPIMQGSLVVRGLRIPAHDVAVDDALVVRVDPRAWLSSLDFDRLAARGEDPVVIAPGDPDYEALVVAMTAGTLPTFEWGTP